MLPNTQAIRAMIGISDLDVRAYRDANTMTTQLAARLEKTVVEQLSHAALGLVAQRSGMAPEELTQLLRFLSEDHETQQRFAAWRTARRLTGWKP